MKRSKVLSFLLVFALLLSLVSVSTLAACGEAGDTPLTRGSFIAAMYERFGRPETESEQACFGDVSPDGDLAPAICWAVDTGIVKGYDNGNFGPEDPVTREQMAAMLYRSAQALGQGHGCSP